MKEDRLFQIAKGGLVRFIPVQTGGIQTYPAVEYTFDFKTWQSLEVPEEIAKSVEHLKACIPIQLAAREWASTGRVDQYAIREIASLDQYQLYAGTSKFDGQEHLSVAELFPAEYDYIKHVPMIAAEEWSEIRFFRRDAQTEAFFALKNSQ